jgi:hypothetical protein
MQEHTVTMTMFVHKYGFKTGCSCVKYLSSKSHISSWIFRQCQNETELQALLSFQRRTFNRTSHMEFTDYKFTDSYEMKEF